MSSNWVDRTNYYSLPRPYNRNRKSVQAPSDYPPVPHDYYGLFLERPASPIPPSPRSREVIKAQVFVHDDGPNSRTPSSFVSPSSEHSNFVFPGSSPEAVYTAEPSPQTNMMKQIKARKRRDRYSFYNDLLELEKRGVHSPSTFIRMDPNSRGPGRYFAYVPTNNPHYWTEKFKPKNENGLKNQNGPEVHASYVKDIAGAHLPIYQRLGAFHGSSSNDVMSQRFKAETLGGRFLRRSAQMGPRNLLRPASVTPDHWWERDPPKIVVTSDGKPLTNGEVIDDMFIRAEVSNPVTTRGYKTGPPTHRRSRSAAPRPHSVYYF